MDIPRPDNFNETYLYEGTPSPERIRPSECGNMLTLVVLQS